MVASPLVSVRSEPGEGVTAPGVGVAADDDRLRRGPAPQAGHGITDDEPERLVLVHDRASGLRAGISVHSTVLGPALGGCRFWPYASREDAITDVTRLGRAMTAKASLAGLDLGGGKSVIIGDPATDRTDERLRAFARLVDDLGGRYVVAEDVGTTTADMDLIRTVTPHVVGCSTGAGGAGDPSGSTAAGVLAAMGAVLAFLDGGPDTGRRALAGRHVVVLGVGKVGRVLTRLLVDAGARVTVADIDEVAVAGLRRSFGVDAVDPADALARRADVFAPCALGGVLDASTIAGLRCRAVVGSANNQLAEPADADRLADRGILYAPDYLVNAGGLIHVAGELEGRFDADEVARRVDAIGATTTTIVRDAARLGITPAAAADQLAARRIAERLAADEPGDQNAASSTTAR